MILLYDMKSVVIVSLDLCCACDVFQLEIVLTRSWLAQLFVLRGLVCAFQPRIVFGVQYVS